MLRTQPWPLGIGLSPLCEFPGGLQVGSKGMVLGVMCLELSRGSTVAVWLMEYQPLFHLKSWDET